MALAVELYGWTRRSCCVIQAYICPDKNCGMIYDINDFGKLDRTDSGGFQCGQCQQQELEIRDNNKEMDQVHTVAVATCFGVASLVAT